MTPWAGWSGLRIEYGKARWAACIMYNAKQRSNLAHVMCDSEIMVPNYIGEKSEIRQLQFHYYELLVDVHMCPRSSLEYRPCLRITLYILTVLDEDRFMVRLCRGDWDKLR